MPFSLQIHVPRNFGCPGNTSQREAALAFPLLYTSSLRRPFPQTRSSECVDFFTDGVFALPRNPGGGT
jgi:hypothetical protein